MYFETLFNSLLELFLLVALGFSLRKWNLVGNKTVNELTDILLTVILPFSVVASGNESCSEEMMTNVGLSFLIVSLYYILAFIISFLAFKPFAGNKETRASSINMAVFANTGFIGIPLSQIMYGQEGMIYAVIYNLIYNVFLFTFGVRLFDGKSSIKESLKGIFLDPLSISSILAIALFFSPVKLPAPVYSFFSTVGNMSSPLSMMIIGAWLVGVDFRNIMRRPMGYYVSLVRLVVLPLLVYFVLSFFDLDSVLKNSVVLVSALPIGSLNVIFAEKYGHDVSFVNETMMLSLCLSLITIPLITLIL